MVFSYEPNSWWEKKTMGECSSLMNKYLSLIIFILIILFFNEIMLQKKKNYQKNLINILNFFLQILLSLKPLHKYLHLKPWSIVIKLLCQFWICFHFSKFLNYKLLRLKDIFMHTWLEIQNDCKKIIIMFKQWFYIEYY